MLEFTTCQMCAKQFIKRPGSIYKVLFAGRVYHFCSYSCYEAAKACKENVQKTSHEALYARLRNELVAKKG